MVVVCVVAICLCQAAGRKEGRMILRIVLGPGLRTAGASRMVPGPTF